MLKKKLFITALLAFTVGLSGCSTKKPVARAKKPASERVVTKPAEATKEIPEVTREEIAEELPVKPCLLYTSPSPRDS